MKHFAVEKRKLRAREKEIKRKRESGGVGGWGVRGAGERKRGLSNVKGVISGNEFSEPLTEAQGATHEPTFVDWG